MNTLIEFKLPGGKMIYIPKDKISCVMSASGNPSMTAIFETCPSESHWLVDESIERVREKFDNA